MPGSLSCTLTLDIRYCYPADTEQERFATCLEYHRMILPDYERRWVPFDGAAQRTKRSITWPKNLPTSSEINGLEIDLGYCEKSPNYRNNPCQDIKFRLAAFFVLKGDEKQKQQGFKMLKELAEHGHPDGMCLYGTKHLRRFFIHVVHSTVVLTLWLVGVVLAEGFVPGIDIQPKQAVIWWRRCVDLQKHIKASFELGVALYTGEGVAENAQEAVRLFRRTAHLGHAGSAYILGECLLDGVGAERDRAEALEWLITAAELGHSLARERVIEILQDDYEHLDEGRVDREEARKWVNGGDEEKILMVNVERRFTVGGGVRNPEVLARRKTKVSESRG